MPQQDGITIARAIRRLDQRGYADESRHVMSAIIRSTNAPRGVMQVRLRQLDTEVARLEKAGHALTRSNPVYRQVISDFQTQMQKNSVLMIGAGNDIVQSGARRADAVIRYGVRNITDPKLYAAFNAQWAAPNPEQISQSLRYVQSGNWADEVNGFVHGSVQAVDDIAVRGLASGWHPLRTARVLRGLVEETQAGAANTLMRTLYLESARKATAVQQTQNRELISRVIRIEALDDRTCMACVALHGTVVWDRQIHGGTPIRSIDEHHNGRGTTITEVQGVSFPIETGDQWFRRQSPQTQRQMFGTNIGYEAYRMNAVQLRDFVQPYDGRVFGPMLRQGSVRGALEKARRRNIGRGL